MTLTLTLPLGEKVYNGRQVTFQAPCESEGLTGLIVDGVTYDLVSSLGSQLVGNSFDAGAMVSVIFNLEARKAYVQNADTNAYIEGKFNSHNHNLSNLNGILPVKKGGTGASDASGARTKLDVYSKSETANAINTAIGAAIALSY